MSMAEDVAVQATITLLAKSGSTAATSDSPIVPVTHQQLALAVVKAVRPHIAQEERARLTAGMTDPPCCLSGCALRDGHRGFHVDPDGRHWGLSRGPDGEHTLGDCGLCGRNGGQT